MALEKKEKETAVATRRPAEVLPRWGDFDRWVDRMFEDLWRRPFPSFWETRRGLPAESRMMRMPAVDLFEEKDELVVKAELPGLSKEDIQVQVADSTLTLKGEKKREEEVREEDYYYAERAHGSFVRTLEIPCEVKADQVKAVFKDGVLEIHLPKSEEAKKKTKTVQVQ